jgi:hypothetical protein
MSKKYKTSEAISMLAEKPELRFKSQLGNEIYVDKCGNIRWQETETTRGDIADLHHLFMKNTWELVQQPVSFMEAVKAYSEGKTIRCEFIGYNGKKYTAIYDDKKENSKYNQLVDNNSDIVSDPVCCEEILNGTWYVEE